MSARPAIGNPSNVARPGGDSPNTGRCVFCFDRKTRRHRVLHHRLRQDALEIVDVGAGLRGADCHVRRIAAASGVDRARHRGAPAGDPECCLAWRRCPNRCSLISCTAPGGVPRGAINASTATNIKAMHVHVHTSAWNTRRPNLLVVRPSLGAPAGRLGCSMLCVGCRANARRQSCIPTTSKSSRCGTLLSSPIGSALASR